jgi:hypothetical protein
MRTEPVGVSSSGCDRSAGVDADVGEPRAAARASIRSSRCCATELAHDGDDAATIDILWVENRRT